MIVTFSLKYREYLRMLRLNKVNRAEKMIANGSYDRERDASPKSLIKTSFVDEKGNEIKKKTVSINDEKISEDERFDGYYALTTDIFKEELPLREVISISARRWEIEECFRIMKTDLEARPFYHSKDDRIIAHFQTCFMALLLLRGVERKIADYYKDIRTFPDGKYTIDEILFALRNLNVFSVGKGQGYIPDYENSELISDLLNIFELQPLGNQVVMSDTLKKIIKKIKTSPAMYKIS
jgi:transposase